MGGCGAASCRRHRFGICATCPLSEGPDQRSDPGGQSPAQGPGGGGHQARIGRHRYPRRLRAGDAHGAGPGTTDPAVLADLARGCWRRKLPALRQALTSRFRPHPAFVLGQLLAHLDYIDEAIATLSAEIERVMAPFAEPLRRLDTIPGINQRTAE